MLTLITMTQGWMFGIIIMMCIFGVAAGIFSAMGKKKKQEE